MRGQARRPLALVHIEYGCGNSTLWYASRVARVYSVENDPEWAARINAQCPPNASVTHVQGTGQDYVCHSAQGAPYDIIAIDGRNRVECACFCVEHLSPGGVLVFDNAERERYASAFEFLADRGFKRLDFFGVVPIIPDLETTAVLYRAENVFGI